MIERLEKELEEELGFTKKVKAALKGLPAEEKSIYDEIDFDSEVKDFFQID